MNEIPIRHFELAIKIDCVKSKSKIAIGLFDTKTSISRYDNFPNSNEHPLVGFYRGNGDF